MGTGLDIRPFLRSIHDNSKHFVRIAGCLVFASERSMRLLRVLNLSFSVANRFVAFVARCARTWDIAIVPVILMPLARSDGKDLSA